jgi:CheY-like chemotaxis protein
MNDNPTPNGKKVLCIEDEHFISDLYVRALQRAGYDVTPIIDGEEGLKQALTNTFDIILLDIMVPNLTGTEALKRLRQQVPDLKAKVIITTNLEQSEENRAEVEQQADGYLVKAEITPRQLVEFLQQLAV